MLKDTNGRKLRLFDIERYALNDGPGIRSAVFFKGCPLRCLWCSNPESQSPDEELFYRENLCIGCGNCIGTCRHGALSLREDRVEIDRELCTGCGECIDSCYTGALSIAGREWSVEETMAVLLKDETFYRSSGGGITFSGGEPTTQPAGLAALASRCRDYRLHTCVETCGYFPWETMEPLLPLIDLVLFDIKHMDSKIHRALTGVGNELILSNFTRLAASNREMTARLPIVPGVNDSDENIEAAADFLTSAAPGIRVDILPYHRLGNSKYLCLGMEYTLPDAEPMSEEAVERIADLFTDKGFDTRVER